VLVSIARCNTNLKLKGQNKIRTIS